MDGPEGSTPHPQANGYDYRLGRFLSVDPIIGDPANPQAVNPYSYIGNNPLSGVDPTGYMALADLPDAEGALFGKSLPRRRGAAAPPSRTT